MMTETLTVVQLNERVRSLLNTSPGIRDVWVAGEISNLTRHSSGHYYFSLKDSGSEIRCTMFKHSRARINFEPKENMKIAAFGRIDLYVQRGQYQFNVETMRASGVGDLYIAYEELKKKLSNEGLFDESRKKPLPKYPKTIGIVTSPTGAVFHDILNVSKRRFPADIILFPALVQGDGAATSIVKGIEVLNDIGVDVMIVGRGGGSIEDLWAFNEEIVARAIFASKVPIISAVGHETDFTIADLVADKRAPTPSAAAEIALPDKTSEMKHIDFISTRLAKSLKSSVDSMKSNFRILDAKLSPKRAGDAVDRMSSRLNGITDRMDSALHSTLDRKKSSFAVTDAKLSPRHAKDSVNQLILRLDDVSESADNSIIRLLSDKNRDIGTLDMRLDGLNPTSVLGRGYSFIRTKDGKTLTSVSGLSKGMEIKVRMRDGTASAEIKEVKKNE